MSVSIKDLKVGDVLHLERFPDQAYVVVKDANDSTILRILNLNNMTLCRDLGDDYVDDFLKRNVATKVRNISTLWRK